MARRKSVIRARYSDFCAVAPSPELKERWQSELDRLRRRRRRGEGPAADFALERKPRPLGFDDGVIVPPEEFPLGTPLQAIRSAAADRAPLRGTVRVIVILVQFSDKAMGATASHFQDLFFSSGVLPHGSVKEFYNEVTNNLITLDGDVLGPYQMPQTLAWYANNNYGIGKGGGAFRSPQLAHDAAVAADPNVNFGPYDNDGNGFVDAFIVVHAGPGAEVTGNPGDIWSHKATLTTAYQADNTKIYGYLTIPEDAKIGVCAHELGHLLFGFPDLYDTDYSSEGIGNWCLMAGGSWNGGGDVPAHPSAWCKANQGWASVTNVTTNGTLTIPDVKVGRNILRLWKDGTAGSEYFLVENRQRTGFDADLPGDGVLVWHIDENQPGKTDENHYEVGLLQADGNRDLELNHNRGDAGDPFPGSANKSSIGASTTPNTKSYAGQDTCVSLSAISPSGATTTATVNVRCGKSLLKDVKDAHKEHKEAAKELKDAAKDTKEIAKDVKDAHKELKEAAKDGKEIKEGTKDIKELKETKETAKDGKEIKETAKDGKEIKEGKDVKDVKEGAKEIKEGKETAGEKGADRPGAGGPGGGIGTPESGDPLAILEARVSALEQALAAGGAEPFIGAELRPQLTGGPVYAEHETLGRMAAGDALAKRRFDAPPR